MLVVTCLIQIITPLVLVIYVMISRKDEIHLNIFKLSQISFPKLVKFSGLIEFMGHKWALGLWLQRGAGEDIGASAVTGLFLDKSGWVVNWGSFSSFLITGPDFETQVNVVVGAVRDPGRFLDWADVVLLVRKNKIGEVLGIVFSKAKSQAALLG